MKIPNLFSANGVKLSTIVKLILSILLLFIVSKAVAQQPAFPTATGAGAYVTGGRGYPVYKVTNLNESGAGSFSQAVNDVKDNGGGIVVFTVSGTIELTSVMSKSDVRNITIAGQTAPAGGITFTGNKCNFQDWDNFIIRYLKFRPLYDPPTNVEDGIRMYGMTNGIVDHCSFSWGRDEVASSTGVDGTHTLTWQRNLFAEGKTGSLFGDSNAPENTRDMSFHSNAFYNITHRFPNINCGGRADHINNVVFNWKFRLSYFGGDIELNSMNNYYIPGCKSTYDDYVNKVNYNSSHTPEIYATGNIIDGMFDDPNADNWELFEWFVDLNSGPYSGANAGSPLTTDYQVNNQFSLLGRPLDVLSARDAYEDVTTNVGANAYIDENGNRVDDVDDLDTRFLTHMRAGDCIPYDSSSSYQDYPTNQHYIDFHNNVSSTPLATGYLDSNDDGMPDAWKIAKGFGVDEDLTTYAWASGYVGIEEFLNEIDGPSGPPVNVTGVAVSPQTATINVPETVTLTKEIQPANATNQSGVWSTNNASIATVNTSGVVTSVSEGEAIITFTTNDGGFTDSATITVTDIPIAVESVTVSPQTLNIGLFASATLTANILPTNASDQTGVWSSSDTSVATIDQQGVITPVAVGVTTITFTTNDGGFSDSAEVTTNDDHFGTYDFYNADTDNLLQSVSGGEVFDLDDIGDQLNFRSIPQNGDSNPDVESVAVRWSGVETGEWVESVPLYAGMTNHTGTDFAPYTVLEGTYTFAVSYYSEDSGQGNVVAVDNFDITFIRNGQITAGQDQTICEGESVTLTASGGETYLWSTGETTESISVSPTDTTTYSVTGTNQFGSSSTAEVTVTVNAVPTVDAGADENICEGNSITLTATGSAGGTYQWSNGQSGESIQVSPNATTTYTVTHSDNGCSSTDEIIVNVNSAPNADAGNDVTITEGESATLTASGGGTYLWSTGETTASISVSPTATATYSVVVTNSSGCTNEADVTVFVEGTVAIDAGGDQSICEGESVTLTATTSGADSYLWSTGETTQSITVSPTTMTTYTVTGSNQYGNSATAEVTVTVSAVPTADAGNDVTLVEGESTILTATGGGTYLWSTGETTESITVSPTATTTYSVTVSNSAGCSSADTVTVNVEGAVNADAGEDVENMCAGDSVTLTASGGDSYEWNTGETTQSITVSPEIDTTYSVVVSNQFSSDTDDVSVFVTDCSNLAFDFRAYPNPTTGLLNVKISGLQNISSLYLYDMLGKQLLAETINVSQGGVVTKTINLSDMQRGFYTLHLVGKDAKITKKIILK